MVILASRSPQRETLLKQIGIAPVVIPAEVDEQLDGSDLSVSLQRLAEQKAETVLGKMSIHMPTGISAAEGVWVIAADTVILLDNTVYGKAPDRGAARKILEGFSGRSHRVLTGVFAGKAARTTGGACVFTDRATELADTEVTFKDLTVDEMSWYLSSGEWREAAGAYRIQGKGACLIAGIRGSFSNVVGLPLERIYGMLVRLGFMF